MRVSEVKELEGECSSSIRKGKKLISYEFKVQLAWSSEALDDVGKPAGPLCTGRYEISDISNDTGEDIDDWEVRTTWGEDIDGWKAKAEKIIRTEAATALKKHILNSFVKELKDR